MIRRGSNRYSVASVAMRVAIALAIAGCSDTDRPMTTLAPKSDLAQWIQNLFIEVTLWDALVFAIVVVAFILALFVFSTRVGEAAPASTASSDLGLEIAWTLGPVLILLMISVPTIRTIFRSQPAVPPAGALVIKVVAHQWWWEFDYPDGAKTGNELHIPVNRPIRLSLESADIIHSFWVPQLGGKTDLIPNHPNTMWIDPEKPGLYLGQCAQFCGMEHAKMLLRVYVDTPDQFAAWVKAQQQPGRQPDPQNAAVAAGRHVFETEACVNCHTISGTPAKGTFGPDLTHLMSRATIAAGAAPNTPNNLHAWIQDPNTFKPGALMPAMQLSDQETDEVVAYLATLH